METIAIIPARGGSKGIPGKNLKELGGYSLLARTILAAIKSSSVSDVYVTSEDDLILEHATQFGAIAIKRPNDLSSDISSSESALLHALNTISSDKTLPSNFFFLQCTSPFLQPEDLDGAYRQLQMKKADTLFSGSGFHHFVWREDKKGCEGINHQHTQRLRRQDRVPEFLENGALYLINTAGFLEHQHRFFGTVSSYEMPYLRSLEVDTPEDFAMAQMLLPLVNENKLAGLFHQNHVLVTDFDGVLTDNKVHLDEDGNETVRCDRADGMGLSNLLKANKTVLVLSSEQNPVVKHRCDKIGVESIQTKKSKATILNQWCQDNQIQISDVVYVGNDINDLAAFDVVGMSLAVLDAHPTVLRRANHIIPQKGGHGAIRMVCDAMLKAGST